MEPEPQIPVKTGRCKCGSKDAADSKAKHCRNGNCACSRRGEPCIAPYCICHGCQNAKNPEGWLIPPEHRPVAAVVDEETETVAEIHPALVEFAKRHVFIHLTGTSRRDDDKRAQLNEIDYKGSTCPQCGKRETTFGKWCAAHVVDTVTGYYYLVRTCAPCNGRHGSEFAARRKTFGLLLCDHPGKDCKCDELYTSKRADFSNTTEALRKL